MASLMQWMWTWTNFGRWWGTGRPGGLQSMGSQRVGHGWVTEQQQQCGMTGVSRKRRDSDPRTHLHWENSTWRWRQRSRWGGFINQEILKMARTPPKPGERKEQTLPHRPQKEQTSLAPCSETPGLQNWETRNFYCSFLLSYSGCGTWYKFLPNKKKKNLRSSLWVFAI